MSGEQKDSYTPGYELRAPYTITTRRVGDREVGVYLLDQAGREDELLESLTATLEGLEARFGPYPYPGYALAEVPSDLAEWTAINAPKGTPLWTDDYVNLLSALRSF